MDILSIDIEWIKCVPALWAIHAMCHMIKGNHVYIGTL